MMIDGKNISDTNPFAQPIIDAIGKKNGDMIRPQSQTTDKHVITYEGDGVQSMSASFNGDITMKYNGTTNLNGPHGTTLSQSFYTIEYLSVELPATNKLPRRTVEIKNMPLNFVNYGTIVGTGTHFANDIDYEISGNSVNNMRLLILYLRGNHAKILVVFKESDFPVTDNVGAYKMNGGDEKKEKPFHLRLVKRILPFMNL